MSPENLETFRILTRWALGAFTLAALADIVGRLAGWWP